MFVTTINGVTLRFKESGKVNILRKINDFDIVRQRHIAEIITGNLVFHEFYVSKMPNSTDTSRHIDEITFPPGKHTSQIDAYRI